MLSIHYIYDRKKESKIKGAGIIQLAVYSPYEKKRKYFSTGIRVAPEFWNATKREILPSHPNHRLLNARLRDLRNSIERMELKKLNEREEITLSEIAGFLSGEEPSETFNLFMEAEIRNERKVSVRTMKDKMRTLKLINEFNNSIPFKKVNYRLVFDFDNFLHAKGYAVNTIAKHHKNMKKFINLAINFKLIDANDYPYRNFRIKTQRNTRTYLNYEEIERIEELDLTGRFSIVRDMFLFSCYTGLRYSDLFRLSAADFSKQNGRFKLKLERMYKVNRRVMLHLDGLFHGKPAELIKPYYIANKDKKYIWGTFFDNSEMNILLKEIQKMAGITKKITVHVGRHTFGTLYAHQSGSIFEVMKAMGISQFETARVYIDLSEEL